MNFSKACVTLLSLCSSLALAENRRSNSSTYGDAITHAVCNNGECTIFRVQVKMNTTFEGSKTVVDHKLYSYGDDAKQYTTKVVRQGNECSKDYILEEHVYRTMITVFDSIVDEDGNILPQLKPSQQAFLAFFLSLIEDKSHFECNSADLGVDAEAPK